MPAIGAISTVNRTEQWGMEATPGTGVAATKRLDAISVDPAIKINVKEYRGHARRAPLRQLPGRQWTEHKITHMPDYIQLAYLLNSAFGLVTPTTHVAGTISKDWTHVGNGGGTYMQPQTFTFEKGDSIRAGKVNYLTVTDIGVQSSLDGLVGSGAAFAQKYQDAITMTPSGVTPVATMPILGSDVNWYMDTTFGNIGTTLLSDLLTEDIALSGMFAPYFPQNRAASGSFSKHVEVAPKFDFKLAMAANAAGMSPLAYVQTGQIVYMRFNATSTTMIENAIPFSWTLDVPVSVTQIQPFTDDSGLYKIEWSFSFIDDPTAGFPWKSVLTTNIATL